MKLENQKFAILLASISGAVYAICSLFVFLFPQTSTRLISALTHLGAASIVQRSITFSGALLGLLQVVAYMYILSLIFTWVFNKSTKE